MGGRKAETIEDLMDRVEPEPNSGCWLWVGDMRNRYGVIRWGKPDHDGRSHRVATHRVFYEVMVGPIPSGRQIDHLCRVHRCVNPAHLEPVTPSENVRRGAGPAAANSRATHCPRGHPYAGANLIQMAERRRCRACTNVRRAILYRRETADPERKARLLAYWAMRREQKRASHA